MNKYTKMKLELDNQKKYNLQLSTSLHKQQKRKSRVMSSLYKANPNIIPNNNYNLSYAYRITHFSHYFPRNKITKKIKAEEDNNILQKMKEEIENLKKNYEKNENDYIAQIDLLNKEIQELKIEKQQLEENIKEIKINKNKEIEKEKQNKHRLLFEEKEKHKKEIDNLMKEINLLKEENQKIKNENDNIINIKKTLEELKEKERNYEKIINELKIENEKLLSQTSLNFKLVKEENDELIKNIKQLNETINKLKIKEKEYLEREKGYIEKEKKQREEKERIEKEKELEKQNNLKKMNENKKYNNNNLKVMRIFSNKFIYKNNNIPEMILKLKEAEKKYNELKKEKEKENIAQNNQTNILITKEIKSLKEKYEKELKDLKDKNTNLNNQIKIINIKKVSTTNSTNNEIKKIVTELSDRFNQLLIKTQTRYDNKIISMKQKLVKIKIVLNKYIKNKNKDKDNIIITELKEEISKLEKEKQKMKVQLSNYDINFKKQNNEITKLKNEIAENNKKINKLNNEARWNHNDKHELNDLNKKLKKQLEMYIIENNGKSKVIEERNNEITKLKELLNKKQDLN